MAETTDYRLKFDPSIIGNTGLRQYGGYVSEEFLKDLRGERGARTYREMADNDGTVGAVLFAMTMLIRSAKPSVQAADDSPEAEAGKVFVEEVMADMSRSWSDVVAEACSMFTYGYAPMEIMWKKRGGPDSSAPETRSAYSDNRIGLRNISLRSQQTITKWEIDTADGSILGVWQQPPSGAQVFIPIEKMLLFRTTPERNNPEGRSILRSAYRSWYMKKRLEEIEGVGVERDLAGLPVAMIPGEYFDPNADPSDKAIRNAWERLVNSVRRDQQEGILIPSDRDKDGHLRFDFKLLTTGGARAFDTSKIIERYDRRIATSVLADFIFLGQQAVGSFALSSDKTALFATALGGFTQSMADVFNRHLLTRLWKLNGLPSESMPTIVFADLERQSLGELAAFVQTLSGAGAQLFPDRELENHLRAAAGLPLAPEDGAGDVNMDAGAPGARQNGQE